MARFVTVVVSVQLLLVSLLALKAEAAKSFTVDYDKDTFLKDGQPFR